MELVHRFWYLIRFFFLFDKKYICIVLYLCYVVRFIKVRFISIGIMKMFMELYNAKVE